MSQGTRQPLEALKGPQFTTGKKTLPEGTKVCQHEDGWVLAKLLSLQ